jgi:hypothetical protein
VAPYSDVYGFGKTCCFGLFGTPQPTYQHWQNLSPALAELLGRCLSEAPAERPADFGVVLQRLGRLDRTLASTQPSVKAVILEAQPVIEEVLPVAEPRPRRRRPRREPLPEPAQSGSAWQWVLVVLVLLAAGAFVVIWKMGGFTLRVKNPAVVPPAIPPAEPIKDEEFAEVLAELKTAKPPRSTEIARRLAVTPVKEANRAEVARDLNPLLKADEPTKIAACQAMANWGTKENVPDLVTRLTADNSNVRGPAIQALVRIKDPKGLDAVADRLRDQFDRMMLGVKESLISCGPAAEDAVLRQLTVTPVDQAARVEATNVLVDIGTAKSIPALEALEKESKGKDHWTHVGAVRALTAIKDRLAVTGDGKGGEK